MEPNRKDRYRRRKRRRLAEVQWHNSDDSDSSEEQNSESEKSERVSSSSPEEDEHPDLNAELIPDEGNSSECSAIDAEDNDIDQGVEHNQANFVDGNAVAIIGDQNEDNLPEHTAENDTEGESGESELDDYDQSEPESDGEEDADEENVTDSESEEDPATSDEEENEPNDEDGDQPIYDGAPITLHESLLAIFTLMSSQHLSGKLMALILKLIALHCPDGSIVKKTLFKFKKYFAKLGKSLLNFHYYCSTCIYPLVSKQAMCPKCRKTGDVSFFIELPLFNQLQQMFKRENFYEDLQYRFRADRKSFQDNLEDIYDGQIYKDMMGDGEFLSNQNNISFMWYSDGVKVFKSSGFSIWPMCLVINELSYKKRTQPDKILLAGLWFGRTKPNPNLFLKPLKKTMQTFEERGHTFKCYDNTVIRVKAKIICGTCDLPAKSLFLRFKQFNSYFGCPRCLIAGARAPAGKTTVQVYPFGANTDLRSHRQTQVHANQALEERRRDRKASVYGVKGPSLVSRLVPDIIRCTAIDVMHGVYLGVCKLLISLWFSSTYSTEPWTLHHLEDIVDNKIRKIKPPSCVQRAPRSLKDVKYWKAAEYKMFFLHYSVPVLKDVMSEVYLKHHCSLVSGISLLSLGSVSPNQVQAASELLTSYVSDFSRLYSLRFLGLNVHQLQHFPEVVLDLGPLWVYSCFYLEGFNGEIGKLFHGTQHVALQICSSISMFMQVPSLIANLNPECKAYQFCNQIKTSSFKLADQIDNETFAVGTYSRNVDQTATCKETLRRCFNLRNGSCNIFYRLKKKGTMFFSKDYQRTSTRKESSYIVLDDKRVGRVLRYVRWTDCSPNCEDYCKNCRVSYYAIIKVYVRQAWFIHDMNGIRLSYMSVVKESDQTIAVNVQAVSNLCIYVNVNNNEYLACPVNTLEVE